MGEDSRSQSGIAASAVLCLLVIGIVLQEISRNFLSLDTQLFAGAGRYKDVLCAITYFGVNFLSVICLGAFVFYMIDYLMASGHHPSFVKAASVVLFVCVFGTAFWTLFTPDALLFSVYENSVDENRVAVKNILQILSADSATGQRAVVESAQRIF